MPLSEIAKATPSLVFHVARRPHGERNAALFGEFGGVIDQVFQRRPQANGVADHEGGKFFRNLDPRLQALGRRPAGERIADVVGERTQIEKILPDAKAGTPASGGIDKQRRQARQMFRAGLDGVDPAALPLIEVGRRQEIADRENAGQRRADLVAEGGERRLDDAGSRGRCRPSW